MTLPNVAPWWAEWVKAGPALFGVALGAGATLLVTVIQRRWQREDKAQERQAKARDLTISRGEELLDQCQQLIEWKENARKVAFTREWQGFVPPQGPMYRIAAIVELFFPDLSNQAQTLDNAVLNYRQYLHGIAMKLQAGSQVSQPHLKDLHEEQDRLDQALGIFLHAARKLIRSLIDHASACTSTLPPGPPGPS